SSRRPDEGKELEPSSVRGPCARDRGARAPRSHHLPRLIGVEQDPKYYQSLGRRPLQIGRSSSRPGGGHVGFHHSPYVRENIMATHLLLRLQENAFGRLDPELTMRQIRPIEILLRKCLPDLSSITLVGDPERPIVHRIERVIIEPSSADGPSASCTIPA